MTTILVDQDLCTRCGICSVVCPASIIDPADENTLPRVPEEKAGMCIRCGHCEAHCPTQAILLNERTDNKVLLPAGAGGYPPRWTAIKLLEGDPDTVWEVKKSAPDTASVAQVYARELEKIHGEPAGTVLSMTLPEYWLGNEAPVLSTTV